jgi:hypothetical protein
VPIIYVFVALVPVGRCGSWLSCIVMGKLLNEGTHCLALYVDIGEPCHDEKVTSLLVAQQTVLDTACCGIK